MRNLDAYSNLRKKDPNKDCDVGCRVILEYETTNEYNEPVKVFSVFPPQSLVAPILEAEFNWLLENRLKDMKEAEMKNINIWNKNSDTWKDYIRSLDK